MIVNQLATMMRMILIMIIMMISLSIVTQPYLPAVQATKIPLHDLVLKMMVLLMMPMICLWNLYLCATALAIARVFALNAVP